MATILHRTYQNIYGPDVVFKRLRTEILEVDRLLVSEKLGTTVDTHKPWVGKIAEHDGVFKLVKTCASGFVPFRYMEGNFFIIFIHGKIVADGDKATIDVKYKLEWMTVAFLSFISVVAAGLTIQSIYNAVWGELRSLTVFILVFVVTPLSLLIIQFRMTDKKISKLLGAE
jgi:hypothetical protein